MPLGREWMGNPLMMQFNEEGHPDERNFAKDYTTVPGVACFTAPNSVLITHMTMVLAGRTRRFQPDDFGTAPALTHGFEFKVRNRHGQILSAAMPGNVLRRNADFFRWSEHIEIQGSEWSTARRHRAMAVHYEPYGAWGMPFTLMQGQCIVAELADDYSAMNEFGIYVVCYQLHKEGWQSGG